MENITLFETVATNTGTDSEVTNLLNKLVPLYHFGSLAILDVDTTAAEKSIQKFWC